MRRWVRERLQPVGTAGVARVYIEQAGVRSDALARTPGIEGVFTVDQSERLTANFGMRVEIQRPGSSGYVTGAAARSITVPENATLAAREAIWFRLALKSVVWGKSVSVRVDLGGRRTIK